MEEERRERAEGVSGKSAVPDGTSAKHEVPDKDCGMPEAPDDTSAKPEVPDGVWGAITGDIVGSVYEFHNVKTTDFPFWSDGCRFTDDTVMTIAVYSALREYIGGGRRGRPSFHAGEADEDCRQEISRLRLRKAIHQVDRR